MIRTLAQEQELRDQVVSQLSQYSFAKRQEIAKLAGVHYNTVHYWVTGKYAPKVDMALKVKEVLDGLATDPGGSASGNSADSGDPTG